MYLTLHIEIHGQVVPVEFLLDGVRGSRQRKVFWILPSHHMAVSSAMRFLPSL